MSKLPIAPVASQEENVGVQPKQAAAQENAAGAERFSPMTGTGWMTSKCFKSSPVYGGRSMRGRGFLRSIESDNEESMPSKRATELAKGIFDDLRGAAHYADSKILGGYLKIDQGTAADRERAAVEILSYLACRYVPRHASDADVTELAGSLERVGIQ